MTPARRVPVALAAVAAVVAVACGSGAATGYDPPPSVTDDAILEAVWSGMAGVEQAELCAEVRTYGARAAARIVTDEASSFSTADVAAKLEEWCL